MLLAIDVGNTQTVIGIFKGDELSSSWRIATSSDKTGDEWATTLTGLLSLKKIAFKDIDSVIVSSVVPSATRALEEMTVASLGFKPLFVSSDVNMTISLKYDNPSEIGADRIVNAEAAYTFYGGLAIVVDFGTATTFDVLSEKGEYLGGAIAPGIEISTDALFEKAAKLSRVEWRKPSRVIGKNTVESLQSGVIYGFAGQVDSMVERIVAEMKSARKDEIKVVVTGGLASLIKDSLKTTFTYDPLLTLKGLKLLHDQNTKRKT